MRNPDLRESLYLAGVGKHRRLFENLYVEAEATALVAATGYTKAGDELAAALVLLRALGMIHQTNHWTSQGDTFYADHLLFERLYSNVAGEIDRIGERAVGVQKADAIRDLAMQAKGIGAVVGILEARASAEADDLVSAGLEAEQGFITAVNALVRQMQTAGALSRGTDNLLADIQDKHEEHIYLLQQRLGKK